MILVFSGVTLLKQSKKTLLRQLDPEDGGTVAFRNVGNYRLTKCNIPEDLNLYQHRYDSLKPNAVCSFVLRSSL